MAELKLVIFDVDGTLVDSIAHIEIIMDRAFRHHGFDAPQPGAVRALIGMSLPGLMQSLCPDLPPETRHMLGETYKQMFCTSSMDAPIETTAPLFAGARDALERLSRQDHLLLGVATGNSRRGLSRVLKGHDLSHFFLTMQVADDHPSKPHPSMVEAALRETGCEAHQSVVIGDTTYDLQMARNAGAKAIGVDWGNHKPELLKPHADQMLTAFEALDDMLETVWEAA